MHPFDIYFPQPAPRPEPTPELAQYALDRMNAGSFPLPGGTMPYEQMVRAQQLANGPTPPTPTQKQEPAKQKGGLTVLPTQEPDQRAKRLSKDLDRQVRQLNTIAATLPPDLQQHAQTSYQLAQQAIEQNDFATAEEIINELNPARLRNVARARYEGPARRARVQARRLGGAARPQMPVDPMAMMGGAMGGASFRPDLMGLRPGKDGAGNVTMTPGGLNPAQQQAFARQGRGRGGGAQGLTPYQKAMLEARAATLRERQRQFDEQQELKTKNAEREAEEDEEKQEQYRQRDLRKEYFDLARNLYNVPEDQRNVMIDRMREIQKEIFPTGQVQEQAEGEEKPMGPIGQQLMESLKEIEHGSGGKGYAPLPPGVQKYAEPGMSQGVYNALSNMDQYLNRRGLLGIPMTADLDGMKSVMRDLRNAVQESNRPADRMVLKNLLQVYNDVVRKATTRRLDSQRTMTSPIGY